jgi:hypothetical protein
LRLAIVLLTEQYFHLALFLLTNPTKIPLTEIVTIISIVPNNNFIFEYHVLFRVVAIFELALTQRTILIFFEMSLTLYYFQSLIQKILFLH